MTFLEERQQTQLRYIDNTAHILIDGLVLHVFV